MKNISLIIIIIVVTCLLAGSSSCKNDEFNKEKEALIERLRDITSVSEEYIEENLDIFKLYDQLLATDSLVSIYDASTYKQWYYKVDSLFENNEYLKKIGRDSAYSYIKEHVIPENIRAGENCQASIGQGVWLMNNFDVYKFTHDNFNSISSIKKEDVEKFLTEEYEKMVAFMQDVNKLAAENDQVLQYTKDKLNLWKIYCDSIASQLPESDKVKDKFKVYLQQADSLYKEFEADVESWNIN